MAQRWQALSRWPESRQRWPHPWWDAVPSPRFVIGIVLLVGVISYLPLYWWSDRIAGLLAGIILLDFSVNACNISDQAAMYAAVPNAASRANTFYMSPILREGRWERS